MTTRGHFFCRRCSATSDVLNKSEFCDRCAEECMRRKALIGDAKLTIAEFLMNFPHTYEPIPGFVYSSQRMSELVGYIRRVASANRATILISGESGVGKELVALALHLMNPLRNEGPFKVADCGTMLNRDLFTSELFGHRKGVFTGAVSNRAGLFSEADGGTMFLDEISTLDLDMQSALLRVIQERSYRPVGNGLGDIKFDGQIIAATNEDLETLVKQGRFRKDLFFRLNVIRIRVPPLRERIMDLPGLVRYYLDRNDKRHVTLTGNALDILSRHSWWGNIRELNNVLERLFLVHDGSGPITEKYLTYEVFDCV